MRDFGDRDFYTAHLGNIRVSEAHHGSAGNHRFQYEPTFILQALKDLHLEFDS